MRWQPAHDGSPHLAGYDGDRLVGQVAHYDDVGGQGPGWVGFVHGHRVTGHCQTPVTARLLVEVHTTLLPIP